MSCNGFSTIFLIAIPITTFIPCNCSTISCSDWCFYILEVCHFFFWVYHMWNGTGICDKCLTVIFLVWHFFDKKFFIDDFFYKFYQIIFRTFTSCINTFLCCCSFYNNIISFYYLCSCCWFIFLPWLSCGSISWHVWLFHISVILVHSWLLFTRSTLNCAHISCKFCRYPCIGILSKGLLIFYWLFVPDCLSIWSYFTKLLSRIPSIVKVVKYKVSQSEVLIKTVEIMIKIDPHLFQPYSQILYYRIYKDFIRHPIFTETWIVCQIINVFTKIVQ